MLEKITMTVEDLAKDLGIGRNTAYDLVKQGRVPALKIGRQIRIPRAAFMNWLASEAAAGRTEII